MTKFFEFVILIAIFVLIGFLLSYPVMLLWNACLVPAVIGLNTISWVQGWGILLLSSMLFKNYNTK